MKKLIMITVIALGVFGCGKETVMVEREIFDKLVENQKETTSRIELVTQKTFGYNVIYIIRVDSNEYILNGDGQMLKL